MPVILRWLLRLGPTNPIAVRLVQNGSRRSRHFYVRAAYLGVLIIVLVWALVVQAGAGAPEYQKLAQAGSASFKFIAYLQIGLICILAPVFMAGAIAQESDPRTWDILLTTPMTETQIVLGNLLGRLFFILALLFSSLPLFAITQYFGGVPGSSIFASYLIAACAALLVGAMAIALAVSRLVGRRAVFAFYVGVVSYIAVTYAIDVLVFGGRSVSWVTALNPFLTLTALLNPSGYPRAEPGAVSGLEAWFKVSPVTTFCVLCTGLSVLLMGVSALTVRLGGLAGVGVGGTRQQGGKAWYQRVLGLAGSDQRRAGRNVGSNPIAWREASARNATAGRMAARYAFIGLGLLLGMGVIALFHTGRLSPVEFRVALLYTVMGELAVIALVAMNLAATSISREREDGTLDLLLTTPITQSAYLMGKVKGIVAYLVPLLAVPVITLLMAGAYVLMNGAGNTAGVTVSRLMAIGGGAAVPVSVPLVLPEAGIIAALAGAPFAAFCVIIGMQWSLKSKGTLGSVVGTVGVVAVITGTIGLCSWNASSDLPVIGPVLGGLSPLSAIHAVIFPDDGLRATIEKNDLTAARVALLIGGLVGSVVYLAVVYAIHTAMTKNFDMTVRRLAGIK